MNLLNSIVIVIFFCVQSIFIKHKCYTGYIFEKEHFVFVDLGEDYIRYTPTEDDVIKSENILKLNIRETNIEHLNQSNKMPVIDKKLNKYIRQYVGFINSKGEKIIWINFIWKNYFSDSDYKNDIIFVKDGGSYYWNIKVDVNNKKLYDLRVNGIS